MAHFFKLFFILHCTVCFFLSSSDYVHASETSAVEGIRGRVVRIIEEKQVVIMDRPQLYQKIELKLVSDGRLITLENGHQPLANVIRYAVNDGVLLNLVTNPGNDPEYVIVDFIRNDSLLLLFIVFVILLLLIAKGKGLFSLFGMIFTFAVIFTFILPRLLAGDNPILIAVVASAVIIPVSFYLSHGLNKKTTIAIIGSLLSLVITAILASIFTTLGHLTGLSSEEAGMLSVDRHSLNMKSILLAGIVIGALGVLDDITVSQAAIVDELATTAKLTKASSLYSRSMIIGKDHITSMVNTLVLAYAGASLPLLLIFANNPHPFADIVNYEIVAEEIIRTLVGSIGLIISVPITTLIASYWYQRK